MRVTTTLYWCQRAEESHCLPCSGPCRRGREAPLKGRHLNDLPDERSNLPPPDRLCRKARFSEVPDGRDELKERYDSQALSKRPEFWSNISAAGADSEGTERVATASKASPALDSLSSTDEEAPSEPAGVLIAVFSTPLRHFPRLTRIPRSLHLSPVGNTPSLPQAHKQQPAVASTKTRAHAKRLPRPPRARALRPLLTGRPQCVQCMLLAIKRAGWPHNSELCSEPADLESGSSFGSAHITGSEEGRK